MMAKATDETAGEAIQKDDPRNANQVVEIVHGKVAAVPVSKHPVATIPETDLSWADIQRRRANPWAWAVYVVMVLLAIVVPYWLGRNLAVNHTAGVLRLMSPFSAQGMALMSWTVTVVAFACLALAIVESHTWVWRILFAVALAAVQLVSGVSLLKFNFWYSTRVVYGDAALLPNAVNLGVIAALAAIAVYAVLFVGLLVAIRKDSPLNVLTRSWASFILFFVLEAVALLIVLFTGIPSVG